MRIIMFLLVMSFWGMTMGPPLVAASGETGLMLSSPGFARGRAIPSLYTCEGRNGSPPLAISNIPAGTQSLALIVDDPDAPDGTWVHWLLWSIPPRTKTIGEGSVPPGARQGKNDFGKTAYGGPCPPSGTHRYFFRLYALDARLSLQAGAPRAELEKAMSGHIISKAELVGTYRRK